jgi:alkylation response protein AidB-like acyl-CoA dehydrogenase
MEIFTKWYEVNEKRVNEHYEREETPYWAFKELCDLGFIGISVPKQYGGQGESDHVFSLLMTHVAKYDLSLTIMIGVH